MVAVEHQGGRGAFAQHLAHILIRLRAEQVVGEDTAFGRILSRNVVAILVHARHINVGVNLLRHAPCACRRHQPPTALLLDEIALIDGDHDVVSRLRQSVFMNAEHARCGARDTHRHRLFRLLGLLNLQELQCAVNQKLMVLVLPDMTIPTVDQPRVLLVVWIQDHKLGQIRVRIDRRHKHRRQALLAPHPSHRTVGFGGKRYDVALPLALARNVGFLRMSRGWNFVGKSNVEWFKAHVRVLVSRG